MSGRMRLGFIRQNEMPAAIRAIDKAFLVHGQEYARMTERAIAAIAIELRRIDEEGFRWWAHDGKLPTRSAIVKGAKLPTAAHDYAHDN